MKKLLFIPILVFFICVNTAFAISTIAWTGTVTGTHAGDWNWGPNWSGGAVPGTGDIVNIGTGTAFTNQPTISTAPANIPSIINIGNNKAVTLTINSGFTLTVGAITMSATSINSKINVNGTLAVTGNIILGVAASNTNNTLTLGTNGLLVLGGTVTGGTLDCGTGNGTIQLNGTVAQTFPATTTTTNFPNDINLLRISNLVGVTLASDLGTNYPALDALTVDNNCTFGANGQINYGTGYVATVGANVNYISKGVFTLYPTDSYDITATVQFTAASQTINLSSTATSVNSCPNVIFTGTTITINGNGTNTIFKARGNISVTGTSTSVVYNSITAIDIDGDFNGTNSLQSGTLPITIGGSWNNSAISTIAGKVTYDGTNSAKTQVVSTNVTYGNNLTFTGASTKQIEPGTLVFQGATFDNSAGSYLDCVTYATTVNMNGAVDQTISGGTATDATIPTDVVTGTTFYNLIIANTASVTPTVTLSGNNNIAPGGVISFTKSNNTLNCTAANSLTLMSTGTGTATVSDITNAGTITGVSITGTVNAQRFITGGGAIKYRSYRFFSSPVYMSTQTLGAAGTGNVYNLKYLNTSSTSYPITTGAAGGGFDKTGNPTIYLFREDRNVLNSVFSGGNYIGVSAITGLTLSYNTTNNTTTSGYLPVGNGFAFFFRGSKAKLAGRTTLPIAATTNYPDDNTVTQAGTLNQGTVPVILWYSTTAANNYQNTLSFTSTNTTSQGFNLVGNPYASSIDWSKFSSSTPGAAIYGHNVLPTVYEDNPSNSVYGTYNAVTTMATGNGNKIISSGQGFFVRTSGTGGTLQFTEQAKSNTQLASGGALLFSAKAVATTYNQYIRLNLFLDTTGKSDIVIGFNPTSTKAYNEIEDDLYNAPLAATNQTMWTSSSDNVELVAKWTALPKAKQQDTINVSVNGAVTGQYTLSRAELTGIPTLYKVWLMDRYLKDSLDLRNNSTYVFNMNLADANSFGSKRFQVIVRQDPALGVHLLNFTALKAITGAQTIWKTENEDHYTNFAIERSTDNGVTYKILDSLVSDASGTYNYIDANPLSVNMYRLKMTDLNGDVTYSNVVTLSYSTLSNSIVTNNINVYPNPSRGIINLAINTGVISSSNSISPVLQINGTSSFAALPKREPSYGIKIISVTGMVVKTTTSSSVNWQDNVSNLSPGTYIIQVMNNSDQSLVGKSTFIKM